MMRGRFCVIVFIVLASCCGPACRADKITVDPYAGQTHAADAPSIDSRLAQNVNYETWHTPVKTILADLAQLTGVKLNAGYNLQDWQVRDRKMNICVKDATLAQVMNSMARVMRFKWSKNDEVDPPTYRLYADRRLLVKLQAEASRRENELKQEVSRRRAGLIDEFARLSTASGASIQKLRTDNPYLYTCAETGFAELVTQMFNEVPRLKETFIGGDKNVIFPISTLSPQTQQLYADVLRKYWKYDSILRRIKTLPDDLDSRLAGLSVHMEITPQPHERDLRRQLWDFGGIGTGTSDGHSGVGAFRYMDSESARLVAESEVTAVEARADTGQLFASIFPQRHKAELAGAKETEYYLMLDPVTEHPDQPDLRQKITVKISDKAKQAVEERIKSIDGRVAPRLWYQAAQKAIAEAAGTGIVSDSFNVVLGEYQLDEKEADLVDVLNAVSEAYECNWEKHGSVIELRRRDWFRRRSSQVPDEWISTWRDELDRTGTLKLDSYAQMATLSPEQKEESVDSDPILSKALGIWWAALNNEGLLRFYIRLTPAQRTVMFSEQGLDPRMLNPEQLQSYADMFHYGRRWAWDTEAFSEPGSRAVVNATCKTGNDGHVQHYEFTVSLDTKEGTKREEKWTVALPRIPRPADKPSGKLGNKQ